MSETPNQEAKAKPEPKPEPGPNPERAPPPTGPTPRRWHPSPAIRVAMALHVAAIPALIVRPEDWLLIVGVLVATHLVLGIAGMWPRSTLLGPNMTRLPADAIARNEVALTFDDGPDPEVTPKVLDILDEYGAKASFFCVAERAEKYPEIVAEIVRRGHSVENHSHHHSNFFAFNGYGGLSQELRRSQLALTRLAGKEPTWFRAPMGIRNPMLEPVLCKLDLRLATWTLRGFDTVTMDSELVYARLTKGLSAGYVLLLHDRSPQLRGHLGPTTLVVLPKLLGLLRTLRFVVVGLPLL